MTNYTWTLVTVGTLVAAGLVAVVALHLFGPSQQETVLVGIVFAFLTPTITSLLTLAKTNENTQKIDEVHNVVNSRMDQLVDTARSEGNITGRADLASEQKKAGRRGK